MFEKTIEKIVLKNLPTIESRLQAALTKSVEEGISKTLAGLKDELFARISRVENEIKEFDKRLIAEQGGFTKLSETVTEIKELVDDLPASEDILTRDGFDIDDYDVMTKDNFDPSDYDLMIASDFSASDHNLVTDDEIGEKVVEALEDDNVKESITEAFIERLKEALTK